jgi:uracil phosphoribosyltransferase
VGALCNRAFEYLFTQIASLEIPNRIERIETRMTAIHPDQAYEGVVLDSATRVVVVDVARAGMIPAQIFYERFNELLTPEHIRQDHLFVSRAVDGSGHVTGASVAAAKVGGPLTGTLLVVPDPMGATGGSLIEALSYYRRTGAGEPIKIICAHLIVTPEYVRRVHSFDPEIRIHALRLDRGFSSPEALKGLPGDSASESGLNDHQYIVPGAGGLGEILNNSWV